MIQVTNEMRGAAYHAARTWAIQHRHSLPDDRLVNDVIATVLALVERDWNMQPNPNARQQKPVRWRCNRTSRCIREDGHTGPHAFTGLDPQ